MSAAKTKAEQIIDENPVGMCLYLPPSTHSPTANISVIAVFSKSYCPFCKATKALLTELGAKYYTIELDQVGMLCQDLDCEDKG
jgi:glutaredoxin 3